MDLGAVLVGDLAPLLVALVGALVVDCDGDGLCGDLLVRVLVERGSVGVMIRRELGVGLRVGVGWLDEWIKVETYTSDGQLVASAAGGAFVAVPELGLREGGGEAWGGLGSACWGLSVVVECEWNLEV